MYDDNARHIWAPFTLLALKLATFVYKLTNENKATNEINSSTTPVLQVATRH